jgi:hypothetical protein
MPRLPETTVECHRYLDLGAAKRFYVDAVMATNASALVGKSVGPPRADGTCP